MDLSIKRQLGRALRHEALMLLATMSADDKAALVAQRPGALRRQILDEEADRLVQLGLAVRTTDGVDLTMLGRIAARVAAERRTTAAAGGHGGASLPQL